MFVYMFHFCFCAQAPVQGSEPLSFNPTCNLWMKSYLPAYCCCLGCHVNPQLISFWACAAWETKCSRSSVGGLNKDPAASSASLWTTALIFLLQNKHVDVRKMKEPERPLCSSPCIVLTVSQLLMSANQTLACGYTFSFGHRRWHAHTSQPPLLLASAWMFTLPNKPQLPESSALDSSIIKAKFISSTKGHSPFSLPVLPAVAAAAAAACRHTVTLQMEPGIHIIKAKMLGHNS